MKTLYTATIVPGRGGVMHDIVREWKLMNKPEHLVSTRCARRALRDDVWKTNAGRPCLACQRKRRRLFGDD